MDTETERCLLRTGKERDVGSSSQVQKICRDFGNVLEDKLGRDYG